MDLTFHWFCRRRSESFGDDVDMTNDEKVPVLPLIKMPATRALATTNKTLPRDGFIGCFGTGVGKLSDNGTSCFKTNMYVNQ